MKFDYLIVAALKEESRGEFEKLDYAVLYTGVGKLNAALALERILQKFKPKAVINLGTAASESIPLKAIVRIDRFIQRDMLCQPLSPKYQTPFDMHPSDIELTSYGDTSTRRKAIPFLRVSCGTGDSFVQLNQFESSEYDIVDMEGYALAKVCTSYRHRIHFESLKYISDSGDSKDWLDSLKLEEASKALKDAASILIENLKKQRF